MKYLAILLGAMFFLTACASGSKIEREAPSPLVDFAAEQQVKNLWSSDFGASVKNAIKLNPHYEPNAIYTTDPQGRVRAYAPETGRALWKTRVKATVTGGAGAGDGLVVITDDNGQAMAFDGADGQRRWVSQLSSQALAPAVVHAGVVVVQTVDGKLTGLAAADGKRIWVYERSEPPLSLRGTSAPVVAGNLVLTGFASGKIAAVQISDGKFLWDIAIAEPRGRNEIERLVDIDVSPLVIRNVLFAASYQGKLSAIDMQTGRIIWSRDLSTYSGMDADEANIYITDDKGSVLALDQRSGAGVWRQEKLRARELTAPRYSDGLIAVGDFEGYVHWLSKEDGHFVARYRVGRGPIRAQAIAGADALYVATQSGVLTALRLEKN